MKTEMIARMEGEKIKFQIRFSGTGWDHQEIVDRESAKYADAKAIGMDYKHGGYTAEVEATPEACAPFIAFAENHRLLIVQI